eukprot:m.345041 g.345041  ORF g.345041 m.345041 type:complete len:597 (+) comp25690_c0_seq1:166-1956(+)
MMSVYSWALAILCVVDSVKAAPLKPHIVFFLADDYGFADVSYHTTMYGNSSNVIKTPNLDALAMQGVRLENYYVQPVCSPTRSCIMTGRYVIHTGVHVPFVDSSQNVLSIDEVTIAQRLKSAGYVTRAVGKWHLGFMAWKYTPQERGFDSFFGYYGGSTDYFTMDTLCWPDAHCFTEDTPTHEAVSGWDLHRDRAVYKNNTEYSTNLFATEAVNIIMSHSKLSDTPESIPSLFLYLPMQAVHVGNKPTPMHPEYGLDQAPIKYINEYSWVANEQRRNLSAMVTVMDEAALNVTLALKEAGMWNRTLFIFSTDNGGPLFDEASNYPLKGGKATLWEGGVRGVGFVVAGDPTWLQFTTSGTIVRGLMHVADWLPTLCDPAIASCDMTGGKPLDGVSAWNVISRNEPSLRNEIVYDALKTKSALRLGNLKVIGFNDKFQLYDVINDPGESTDLSNSTRYASNMTELVNRIMYWRNESADVPNQADAPVDFRSNPVLHNNSWLPWLPDNCSDSNCPPPQPGPSPSPAPPPAHCNFSSNMDMYPEHTHPSAQVDSPQECCQACKAAKSCFVAVFAGHSCYFKPEYATPRPRPGSTTCIPVM